MTREHLWNVKLSDAEHSMLSKLSEDSGEAASVLFRRWLREHWIASGYIAPPAKSARSKR